MKKYLFFFIIVLQHSSCQPSAITYELNGGRFGDNLNTYSKAKIFSYKYEIPLLYKPFEYSDQLILHYKETHYSTDLRDKFDAIIEVKTEDDIKQNKSKNVLFVTNFYTPAPGLYEYGFTNREKAEEVIQLLTPIILPPKIQKQENETTIAVHVRKGGGFDAPLASQKNAKKTGQCPDQKWPTKFPPDQYYIDQIKMIKKLIAPEKNIIIYLFTDDPNPGILAQQYHKQLQDINLEFRFRTKGNSHDAHVVEDFYQMAQCDYLIRSSSLLARASQLVGSHKIIIHPIQGYWVDEKLIINPVGIIIRDPSTSSG